MHNIRNSKELGFTLIEAMVSLLVISVGMIGMAALYGQGLAAARTAVYRTQAINLAADMADRIRANRLAGSSYNGAGANNNCDPGGGVKCTVAQMAANDVFVWTAQVATQLPAGAGTVVWLGTQPPTYTINVRWDEVGTGVTNYTTVIRVPDL